MLFDSHIHTCFSADSSMTAQEALAAAAGQGIGLVFTEHIDFSYPGALKFLFSPEEYWRAYEPLRGEGLALGAEVGLVPGEKEEAKAFLDRAPFDQVIGSIHLLDGRDLYEPAGYEHRAQRDMYGAYFRLMAEMVREHSYIDVLGHIDYISRYAPYDSPGIRYEEYGAEIDDVLRAVIETDTVLELNTRRFHEVQAREELLPIYRRYRELGGKYVTLGSDAHTPGAVGAHLAEARQMSEACGLTVGTFWQRKWRSMAD